MKAINLTAISLIFFAGASVPLAVAINTALGRALKNPVMSGVVATCIATLVFFAMIMISKTPRPTYSAFSQLPWYLWTGGVMFALYILILVFNSAKVGLGFSTSLVVAGQLAMSLALDHYGAFGMPQTSLSFGRLVGVFVVMGGVALIKIF